MEQIAYKGVTWINIDDVTLKDTEELEQRFHFHPLDLKDCLGAPQRPKIDIYDNYFFLILHFPYFDKEKKLLKTADINIFLLKDYVITVQKKPISYVQEVYKELRSPRFQNGESYFTSPALLLYYTLDKAYHHALSIIDILNTHITDTEEDIYEHKARQAVRELAKARRNNLTVRAMLNPQRLVINTLAHMQKDWFNKDGEATLYYDDILDYLEKNWVILENQKELVDGLYETNESLLSYKTNAIITVLTVFSVSIMPLTLLTGFWGMNIDLPFIHHPAIIWLIFLAVLLLTLGVIHYLTSRKEWI